VDQLWHTFAMCFRKIFIHHRCGHTCTELVVSCGAFECKTVSDKEVISNKYPCVFQNCVYWGQF
jgi:hypothetical protein